MGSVLQRRRAASPLPPFPSSFLKLINVPPLLSQVRTNDGPWKRPGPESPPHSESESEGGGGERKKTHSTTHASIFIAVCSVVGGRRKVCVPGPNGEAEAEAEAAVDEQN